MENLSEGGVFLRTAKPQPIGTKLAVKLALPGCDSPLVVTGRVVRVAHHAIDGRDVPIGMGIEFIELTEEKRSDLRQFLAAYEARAPGDVDAVSEEEPEALRREITALRQRLAETEAQAAALHTELEKFEHHDDNNQTTVQRLFEEVESLRRINKQEKERTVEQVERLTEAFNQRLAATEAKYKKALASKEQETRGLLGTELEEQLSVERSRSAELEKQLKVETDAARERVAELERKHTDAQDGFEASLAGSQREAQELLGELAEEQEALEKATETIAELEARIAKLTKQETVLRGQIKILTASRGLDEQD